MAQRTKRDEDATVQLRKTLKGTMNTVERVQDKIRRSWSEPPSPSAEGIIKIEETKPEKGELTNAVKDGNFRLVRKLLERGADPNERMEERMTPLMAAAEKGYVEIGRKLVLKGALVDLKNSWGWTALMIATLNNREEMVDFLLSKWANPTIEAQGLTALKIAIDNELPSIANKIERAIRENVY